MGQQVSTDWLCHHTAEWHLHHCSGALHHPEAAGCRQSVCFCLCVTVLPGKQHQCKNSASVSSVFLLPSVVFLTHISPLSDFLPFLDFVTCLCLLCVFLYLEMKPVFNLHNVTILHTEQSTGTFVTSMIFWKSPWCASELPNTETS